MAFDTGEWIGVGGSSGNTWGGCAMVILVPLGILAIAMGIGIIAPILICALVGWFGGKLIGKIIEWFFVG
tara:strand:- start:1566 stop:1775 length:210 start_codon:yes stop_codon:yes gene_type:complete